MAVSFPGAWGSCTNPQDCLENTAFQGKTGLVWHELSGWGKPKQLFSSRNRWNTATAPVLADGDGVAGAVADVGHAQLAVGDHDPAATDPPPARQDVDPGFGEPGNDAVDRAGDAD